MSKGTISKAYQRRIILQAKDLGSHRLGYGEILNMELVRRRMDEHIRPADVKRRKAVKVKLLDDIIKIDKRASFPANRVAHSYTFAEHPGLLVLAEPDVLHILQFKHTGDLNAFCENVEMVRGPILNGPPPQPNLTLSGMNGYGQSPRPLDRMQRTISLPTATEIQPPLGPVYEAGVMEPRNYLDYPREPEAVVRRTQYFPSEQWITPTVVSPVMQNPRGSSLRVSAGPAQLGHHYYTPASPTRPQRPFIESEIIDDDSPIISRRNYNVASTSFMSSLPAKKSPTYRNPNSRSMTLNGQKRWVEESKRLTYNARKKRMEEDRNGEILWFVAHEIPIEEDVAY